MSITFFLLEVGRSMLALFKAIIPIIDNYKNIKNKKLHFLVNFDLE